VECRAKEVARHCFTAARTNCWTGRLLISGEHTRLGCDSSASRRRDLLAKAGTILPSEEGAKYSARSSKKNVFGETPNTTRETQRDAYAPQNNPRPKFKLSASERDLRQDELPFSADYISRGRVPPKRSFGQSRAARRVPFRELQRSKLKLGALPMRKR
jgi:hypothetical protein